MNFAYQLVLSVSEIFIPVLFVLLIKKAKLNVQKIKIRPVHATGNERILFRSPDEDSAEIELMEILTTRGISAGGTEMVMEAASRSGIIYHSNLIEMKKVLLYCKKLRVRIFNKSTGAIQRQVFDGNPISGIILAHIMDKNIELI